mgnify:CR=1 FL=1|jgi:hypothetical protein
MKKAYRSILPFVKIHLTFTGKQLTIWLNLLVESDG